MKYYNKIKIIFAIFIIVIDINIADKITLLLPNHQIFLEKLTKDFFILFQNHIAAQV